MSLMDDDSPPPMRARATSISEFIMSLHTHGSGAATHGLTVGECFLDSLCLKYACTLGGRTIYVDGLYTNIIGEFSLDEFLKVNQVRCPVIRTEYVEVQEINKVSYKSMHTVTKVDKKWLPVTERVIPGISLPLLLGMNFKDGHAEDPDMQRKLSNTPKIIFFKDNKVPNPNVTVKHLGRIHRDMDHADHSQMATECIRLGCKMNKSVELMISRVIQECNICSWSW